RHTLHHT
ncbi:unnamed protein product, partial [Adineta ricciae]